MAGCGLPLGLQPLWGWKLPGRLEPMGNREVFQGPGHNICLHQGPIWKCDSKKKKDRGRKKEERGEGEKGAKRDKTEH